MKKVLLGTLLLLLSLTGLLLLFLNSSLGLNFVYQQTRSLLPGKLIITNLSGSLFGTIKADNIYYKNSTLTLDSKQALITWQPLALLNKTLMLRQLSAETLTIQKTQAQTLLQQQKNNQHKPLALNIHIENIDINQLNYADEHKLKFTAKLHLQRQWQTHWQLSINNLNGFNKQMHGSLTTNGSLTGNRLNPYLNLNASALKLSYQGRLVNQLAVNIHGQLAKHKITLDLAAPNFSTKLISIGSILIDHQSIFLKEKIFTSQNLSQIKNNPNAALSADITLSRDWQNLQADLTSKLQQLNFLPLILPEIKDPQGDLHLNIKASSLNKKPNITGQASLTKATASIPKLGLNLKNIKLQINSRGDNIIFNGSMQQNDSKLNINGQSNWRQNFNTKLNLIGNNVEVINTNEYQASLSPNLAINYTPAKLSISGKILVDSAKLNPRDFQQTLTASPDIHYLNSDESKQSTLPINSDIDLQLSDKVVIHAYGLKGKLQGGLRLKQAPNHPTYGQGQLTVKDGRYHAFGKDFTIQTGRLIFSGGLVTDPGINVRAIRELKVAAHPVQNGTTATANDLVTGLSQLTVGVNIAGTLKRPRISLFSEPGGLSQSDILSYLIVGRPTSQAGAGGASSIIQAANALNLGASANDIEAQIQQAFGLDTLTMASQQNYDPETNTVSDNTALMLGKYLNPKLYVSYSIGLMEPVNTLNFTYQLTHLIALQTETNGFASGADILYSFSRD